MTARALRLVGLVLLLGVWISPSVNAQRVHGSVVGIRGNSVDVRLSPSLDVRPGVRGTIYGNVRGRQGIIARITSARKVGNTWNCTITRSALRVQPGHTVTFVATVPVRRAEPPPPPDPGTIVINTRNAEGALVTSGGVRMGQTEYSQRFSPRNATFYVQKDGFQTERVVADILAGQTTRREVTLREVAPSPEPTPVDPEPTPGEPSPEEPLRQPAPEVAPPSTEPSRDPGFPPPPDLDATLTVYVNQPDVDLVVNGLPVRRIREDRQAEVRVIPGTYDVSVYKGGYFALAQRVRVGANAEEALRFDLIEARAQIAVNSDPVGARVKVAGVEVGSTPLIIPYAAGRFEVTVEADGYRPVSEFLVAEPDTTVELVVGLEPALGWVFVGASPDAEVRVDGVFVDRGSQSLQLMAGRYTIEVREAGETVLRREVEVLAGSEESLAAPGTTPPRRP